MRLAVGVVAALVLGPALSGCSARAPTAPVAQRPHVLVAAEDRSDVGNGRPQVSFDGLMVRRRIVLAIRLDRPAALAAARRQLDQAATRSHTTVSPVSASVLDPVPLEQLAPNLVVALPAGATLTDGQRLMDLALPQDDGSSIVRAQAVLSVLVHDLRFTVHAAHPAALSRAISREGILSDALGNYTSIPRARKLSIVYTGPLLGDNEIHSVQVGIARRAHVARGAVTVAPRTLVGAGVDVANLPVPAPDESFPSTNHHDH